MNNGMKALFGAVLVVLFSMFSAITGHSSFLGHT